MQALESCAGWSGPSELRLVSDVACDRRATAMGIRVRWSIDELYGLELDAKRILWPGQRTRRLGAWSPYVQSSKWSGGSATMASNGYCFGRSATGIMI